MQIALIAPRSMLEWTRMGDIHFIIPPTADKKFYAEEGRFKLLDNGVYETGKAMSLNELFYMASYLHVDEIVAPDVMFDEQKTHIATYNFYRDPRSQDYRTMIVPQAKTPNEWIYAYDRMNKSFPQADIIGVPKWLDGKFHCRAALLRWMSRKGLIEYKQHHLLGIDSLADLMMMPYSVWIRSCDTSKPFTFAANCKKLSIFSHEDFERIKFDAPPIKNERLLRENIETLKTVARWNLI